MNFEEIEKIIREDYAPHQMYYQDYEDLYKKVGNIDEVYSSLEADGQEMNKVLYFTDHNVYIQLTGWYSSWGDCEFDDKYVEVFPFQKVITIYCQNQEEANKFTY